MSLVMFRCPLRLPNNVCLSGFALLTHGGGAAVMSSRALRRFLFWISTKQELAFYVDI